MSDPLPLVVANHKANKTLQDFNKWAQDISHATPSFKGTVIVCPSSPFLSQASILAKTNSWKIKIGSQDISAFDQGAYTGETAASQLKNICDYSIVGHSERRNYFKESDELLEKKVKKLHDAKITPIFCVQDETTPIPEEVGIVAYEPVFAIGTGNPDTPENAKEVAKKIKTKGDYTVIYGGSVSGKNANSFVIPGLLEGVLIGTASLDSQEFLTILKNI